MHFNAASMSQSLAYQDFKVRSIRVNVSIYGWLSVDLILEFKKEVIENKLIICHRNLPWAQKSEH